jgi:hypothetical protein
MTPAVRDSIRRELDRVETKLARIAANEFNAAGPNGPDEAKLAVMRGFATLLAWIAVDRGVHRGPPNDFVRWPTPIEDALAEIANELPDVF